jgi:flagellar hook assembly protein FlgD
MARARAHKRAARVAAVSIITLMAALAAIWCAPRVSEAVAAWVRTPQVHSATIAVPAGLPVAAPAASAARTAAGDVSQAGRGAGAVTVDAGLRFTMIGVTCSTPAHADRVLVDIRTSLDGRAWSRWYTASLDVQAEAGSRTPQAFIEALWTGPGRFVQVAARPARDAAPAALRDVRVVAIDSTEQADAGAVALGVIRRTVAVVAGLGAVRPAAAMTDKPALVTREEWGADESLRTGTPDYADPVVAFVHHTASGNDYSRAEAASVVRGAYYYHTKALHWSDIGYNFLVDKYGTVYEGRYGGVTRGVIGAQVLGFNTHSFGVSVIGTYSKVTPTSATIQALESLLAWKLDVHHVDPQGTGTLTCGYGEKFSTGESVTLPAIAGHRDANYTECPGNRLYALLPEIRKTVAAMGQPKIFEVELGDPFISPDGDGVRDTIAVTCRLSQDADWKMRITDAQGTVVRSVSGTGKTVEASWSGHDNDGARVPDGTYTLTVDATSPDGEARPATAAVYVDTTPPRLQSAAVSPTPFSPNGDGQDDVAGVTFKPGEAGTARVTVVDENDRVVRTLMGWRSVGASSRTVPWDGRVNDGGKLVDAPEGKAVIVVEMRDLAGNSDSVRRAVIVDRTLGFPVLTPAAFSPNADGVKDSATLAFRLTRRADVTLNVLRASDVVRTLSAGTMVAGSHEVVWDGTVSGGGAAASGLYRLQVLADGAEGETSVSAPVTVDRSAPKFTVPAEATAKPGKAANVSFTVRDAWSSTVKVTVAVTDAGGAAVGTVACGWVKQGKPATCTWKATSPGVYALTFAGVDRAGNGQSAPAVTRLTVR